MDDLADSSEQSELTSDDGDPDQRLKLDCVRQAGDWAPCEPLETLLHDVGGAIAQHVNLPVVDCEAAVAFSDDASVTALNGRFRNRANATNVLSFPAIEPEQTGGGARVLGDVILAADTVMREAREKSISVRDHAAHLIVHGVLHLVGFDHQTDAEADAMERTEVAILAGLAIADPYQQPDYEEVTGQRR